MSHITRIGPLVFALVGAGVGICLAMLFRNAPDERSHVYIDDSMPFFIGGCIGGVLVGCVVSAACARWAALNPALGMVSTVLLGAAMTAPLGWIVGDEATGRFPVTGML